MFQFPYTACNCTAVQCVHWSTSPTAGPSWNNCTASSNAIYDYGVKPVVNTARWFDVFRTWWDYLPGFDFLPVLELRRCQERSDKLQRRKHKRRHFVQALRSS